MMQSETAVLLKSLEIAIAVPSSLQQKCKAWLPAKYMIEAEVNMLRALQIAHLRDMDGQMPCEFTLNFRT